MNLMSNKKNLKGDKSRNEKVLSGNHTYTDVGMSN